MHKAIFILPAVFFLVGIISSFSTHKKFTILATSAILLLSILALLETCFNFNFQITNYLIGNISPDLGIEYQLNGLARIFFTIILFFLCIFIFDYLISQLRNIDQQNYFLPLLLVYFGSAIGIFFTNDIFHLYVFLEVNAFASYLLIASNSNYHSYKEAFNYLVFGSVATSFVLIGIALIYGVTGALNYNFLRLYIEQNLYTSPALKSGVGILIIGLCMKSALLPLSKWLIKIYYYASNNIANILLSISNKIGIYILFQLGIKVLKLEYFPELIIFLQAISILAIIQGYWYAKKTKNLKLFYIYSSFAQIGLIIFCVTLNDINFYCLVIILVLAHIVEKFSMFYIFSKYENLGPIKFNLNSFFQTGNCNVLLLITLFFALSAISFPLTLGFVSKWYMLKHAFAKHFMLFILNLMISMFAIVSYFNIIQQIFCELKFTGIITSKIFRSIFIIPIIFVVINILLANNFVTLCNFLLRAL